MGFSKYLASQSRLKRAAETPTAGPETGAEQRSAPSPLELISVIPSGEPMPVASLAALTGLDASDIATALDRLRELGLVTSTTVGDEEAVVLTDRAAELKRA